MSDREFLNGLATFMEAAPSMGSNRKDFANRIRAIAAALPEGQDTEGGIEVTVRRPLTEPVYTTGLPSGVFVFTAPSPSPESPPTVVGLALRGQFYGDASKAYWCHVPGADAEEMTGLEANIRSGNIDTTAIIQELRQYRTMAGRA